MKPLIQKTLPSIAVLLCMSCLLEVSGQKKHDKTSTHPIPTIQISNDFDSKNLNKSLSFLHSTDAVNLNNLLSKISSNPDKLITGKSNLGINYRQADYWTVFVLRNETGMQQSLVLEIDEPRLDIVEVYEILEDRSVIASQTGDSRPFASRPLNTRQYAFPILIEGNEARHIAIKLKKLAFVKAPVFLHSASSFNQKWSTELLFSGIYFGLVVLVSTISLILGLYLKKKILYSYLLFVCCNGIFVFTNLGLTFQYLIPDHPTILVHVYTIPTHLVISSFIFFSLNYFKHLRDYPKTRKVLNAINAFIVISMLYVLIPEEIFSAIAPALLIARHALTLVAVALTAWVGILFYRREKFLTTTFFLAYSPVTILFLVVILNELELIKLVHITIPQLIGGFLIELIVLSVGMSRYVGRIYVIAGKETKQRQELQKEKERLEEKVQAEHNTYLSLSSKAVLPLKEITHIKSDGPYVEVFHLGKPYPEIDRKTLKELLAILPSQFVQTHKSYIVNLDHVKSKFATKVLLEGSTEIPVSRTYKVVVEHKTVK